MKRNSYIISVILGLLLLYACSDTEGILPTPPGGEVEMVKINFIPPYIGVEGATRAGFEEMPDSSTIRLFIYRSKEGTIPGDDLWGNYNPNTDNPLRDSLEREVPLLVITDELGIKRAIPCKVDDDGKYTGEADYPDIVVPANYKYDFFTISPAIKLEDRSLTGVTNELKPAYTVNNGNTKDFMTNYPRLGIDVLNDGQLPIDSAGFYDLRPQPYWRLTSRITFKLSMGTNVNELGIEDRGIEMNGLYIASSSSPNFLLRDTVLRKFGLEATDDEVYAASASITDYYYYQDAIDPQKSYWFFEMDILPSDEDRPKHNVNLRFHLKVNGDNYKAYTSTLDNALFKPGHCYNYEVKVNVAGLFVTGWTSSQWSTIITDL